MRLRIELEKKVEKEKAKIADLRSQIDKAEAFVAGLQEALRMLPKEGTPDKPPEAAMRAGSDMSKVRDLLKKVGKPLYISDILKGIGKEVTPTNRTSISGSLDNYARRGTVFTKVATRTYGLVDFGDNTEEEPPPNFGVDNGSEEEIPDDEIPW